jgi:hypothetical protein
MANNEWGDFQTPAELAARVVASLGGCRWSRVLEPTCGTGRFLAASTALGTKVERLGIEIQAPYVVEASAQGFTVLQRSIFDLDLGRDLSWTSSGPLLVMGNPPWVTSSQLGSLGSINLPPKSNVRNFRGLDAMTGASNFDIAEFIFLKLMLELRENTPTIALLVKTQVARNVLSYAEQFALPYSNFTMRSIDAKLWFGASVDACLFTVEYSENPVYTCAVYPDLNSQAPSHTIGVIGGLLVADVEKYGHSSFADGKSPVEWRSGVKHDASGIMELTAETRSALALEDDYIFPLLKCTDLFRNRLMPTRYMIVPQLTFGEDTAHLRHDAPKLWSYLESNSGVLDSRGSSIYKTQPRFAVFGLGEYTFAPYKIAISGLHKEARFVLLGQHDGRPIVVDDASYTVGFQDGLEAAMCFALLETEVTSDLLESLVFWDAKRPISKRLLQRIDLDAVADKSSIAELSHGAETALASVGLTAPASWVPVIDNLRSAWENSAAKARTHRSRTTQLRLC